MAVDDTSFQFAANTTPGTTLVDGLESARRSNASTVRDPAAAPEAGPLAYAFAGFTFDPHVGLERAGRRIPLAPTEQRLLAALLEAGGRIVTKDELVWRVWRGAPASDNSISRAVCAVRRALRTGGADPVVETIYATGFRIAVPVAWTAAPLRSAPAGGSHPIALACLGLARDLLRRGGTHDVETAAAQLDHAVQLLQGGAFAPAG